MTDPVASGTAPDGEQDTGTAAAPSPGNPDGAAAQALPLPPSAHAHSRRAALFRRIRRAARRISPFGYFVFDYRRSSRQVRSMDGERERLFEEFLRRCTGACIQIAVKEEIGRKFGPNWVSVDRYDRRDFIDRHDDVEALQFQDRTFDAAVCWSVLEHIPRPQAAIAEIYRVLKPGGLIWVQLPFLFPYHGGPRDYWRVTPSGLRVWMEDFEEIACACDYWAGTSLVAATYFYGRKPALATA
jgi:SAM-dependent methyltransferase